MLRKLKHHIYNDLRAEAAKVYSTAQPIRSVITSVGMSVGDVDVQGAAKYIWDSLLGVAEEQQKLEDIVNYITAEFPANEVFTNTQTAIKNGSAFLEPVNVNGFLVQNNEHAAKVFMVYAPENAAIAKRLKNQLFPLVLNGEIVTKDMTAPADADPDTYQLQALGESEIVLLLLTADFFSQDNNCLQLGFTAKEKGKRVVPILIEETLWGRVNALKAIVPLPINKIPVSKWSNEAEALMNVADGVGIVARDLKK